MRSDNLIEFEKLEGIIEEHIEMYISNENLSPEKRREADRLVSGVLDCIDCAMNEEKIVDTNLVLEYLEGCPDHAKIFEAWLEKLMRLPRLEGLESLAREGLEKERVKYLGGLKNIKNCEKQYIEEENNDFQEHIDAEKFSIYPDPDNRCEKLAAELAVGFRARFVTLLEGSSNLGSRNIEWSCAISERVLAHSPSPVEDRPISAPSRLSGNISSVDVWSGSGSEFFLDVSSERDSSQHRGSREASSRLSRNTLSNDRDRASVVNYPDDEGEGQPINNGRLFRKSLSKSRSESNPILESSVLEHSMNRPRNMQNKNRVFREHNGLSASFVFAVKPEGEVAANHARPSKLENMLGGSLGTSRQGSVVEEAIDLNLF